MRKDDGGMFWDTIFDAVSICFSVADVICNPDDPWAWVGLAADVVSWNDAADKTMDTLKVSDKAIETLNTGTEIAESIGNFTNVSKNITEELVSSMTKTDIYDGSIDTYKNLKKIAKGTGNEVHHIVEKRFLKGNDFGVTARNMESVILDKDTHRVFTNAWREALPYGDTYTPQQIYDAAQKVYKDYPSLLESVRRTLKI